MVVTSGQLRHQAAARYDRRHQPPARAHLPLPVRLPGTDVPSLGCPPGRGDGGGPDESRPGASQRGPAHRPAAQGAGAPSGPPSRRPAGQTTSGAQPPSRANFRRPMVQDSGTPSDAGATPPQVFTDEPGPTGTGRRPHRYPRRYEARRRRAGPLSAPWGHGSSGR